MTRLSTLGGKVLTKKADGSIVLWDAKDAVGFWRASDYSGSGPLKNLAKDTPLHDLDVLGPEFLPFSGTKYLAFLAQAGNVVTTPTNHAMPPINDYWAFTVKMTPKQRAGTSWLCVGGDMNNNTASGVGGMVYISNADGRHFFFYGDGTTQKSFQTPGGMTEFGVEKWYKWSTRVSTKTAKCEVSYDGINWVELWSTSWLSLVSAPATDRRLVLGGVPYASTTNPFNGDVYQALITSDTTISINFVANHMSTFGGVSGARDWVITRSTSGRRLSLVDRPMFSFSNNLFMEAPHHPELNLDLSSGFTVIVCARSFGNTSPMYIGKRVESSTSIRSVGWLMRSANTSSRQVSHLLDDGVDAVSATSFSSEDGVVDVLAFRKAEDGLLGYRNELLRGPYANALDLNSIDNTETLKIGKAGTVYSAMEFFGAAVYPRPLTIQEITDAGKVLGAA